MSKKRTNASRYPSKYGGGHVTAAQWVAELMCERMAVRDKKALPLQFWNTPEWEKAFKNQLRLANALFKLYDPAAISSALRAPAGRKIYSLGAKWFDDVIKKEQARIERERATLSAQPVAPELTPQENTQPRPAFIPQKSTLNTLKGV